MAPPPPPLPPPLHPNHNPGATFRGQREDGESGDGDSRASGDGEAQPTQTRNARTRPMTGTAMPRLLVWTPPPPLRSPNERNRACQRIGHAQPPTARKRESEVTWQRHHLHLLRANASGESWHHHHLPHTNASRVTWHHHLHHLHCPLRSTQNNNPSQPAPTHPSVTHHHAV